MEKLRKENKKLDSIKQQVKVPTKVRMKRFYLCEKGNMESVGRKKKGKRNGKRSKRKQKPKSKLKFPRKTKKHQEVLED